MSEIKVTTIIGTPERLDEQFEEQETLSSARKKLRIIYKRLFENSINGFYKVLKPVLEVTEESEGVYKIRLMKNDVKTIKVNTFYSNPQMFYQIDPLTGFPRAGYF